VDWRDTYRRGGMEIARVEEQRMDSGGCVIWVLVDIANGDVTRAGWLI